jgi:hypothetical protein
VDAAFFDADGDGRPDLYVVSGGNEFWGDAPALRDRLYLNDGRGHFRAAPDRIPAIFQNGACVTPGDYDGDGDVDLFVGGRVVSRQYGLTPPSRLLRNDGGRFTDVTREVAPALAEAGMVTSAAWIDREGDRRLELVVVGEWMPVRLFAQRDGRFVERTREAGLAGTEGWWSSVTAADVNADGRPDLVLGNLGLNSYVKASPDEPARLYVADFAKGGDGVQQVLTFYKHGVSYPMMGRDELVRLIPSLRSRYPAYRDFGASTVDSIFPAAELRKATVLEAHRLATSVALNAGGRFSLQPLPADAQLAPVFATAAEDFDGDGRVDLLLGGTLNGVPPIQGRYDASYGLLLRGVGGGRSPPLSMPESGGAAVG